MSDIHEVTAAINQEEADKRDAAKYRALATATIHNPVFIPCAGGFMISGSVYGDRKGRFNDGEHIVTSKVLNIDEAGRVTTRNSVYQLKGITS